MYMPINNHSRQPSREIEIAGRRYVTATRLAEMLGVTVRTLSRWEAAGIGAPKIKIGKLTLFDVAKLPQWLATRETIHHSNRRPLERIP
jgi:phage terminase Nu1 subunit (DNA packaging protein)